VVANDEQVAEPFEVLERQSLAGAA